MWTKPLSTQGATGRGSWRPKVKSSVGNKQIGLKLEMTRSCSAWEQDASVHETRGGSERFIRWFPTQPSWRRSHVESHHSWDGASSLRPTRILATSQREDKRLCLTGRALSSQILSSRPVSSPFACLILLPGNLPALRLQRVLCFTDKYEGKNPQLAERKERVFCRGDYLQTGVFPNLSESRKWQFCSGTVVGRVQMLLVTCRMPFPRWVEVLCAVTPAVCPGLLIGVPAC